MEFDPAAGLMHDKESETWKFDPSAGLMHDKESETWSWILPAG